MEKCCKTIYESIALKFTPCGGHKFEYLNLFKCLKKSSQKDSEEIQ